MFAKPLLAALVAVAPVLAAGAASAEGDPARGERLFRAQCLRCHLVEPVTRPTGPTLHNVFGRTAGSIEDFNYSPAMKDSGIVWTAETIDAYLASPRTYIPGNRMAFAGLPREDMRADIIAFLKLHSEPVEGAAADAAPAEGGDVVTP